MRILRSVLDLSQLITTRRVHTQLGFLHSHQSLSNKSIISSMSTTSTAQWDAELGVWVGERAPFCDQSELPDPLYILGYGSLIWRPGELLEKCKTYKCTALGSMRIFAQKSCDHRGTPEFPGLVLNLVKDEMLEELGYREPDSPQSEFRGMVWLVPPELAQSVIEDLDYRERGGYHRHTITVKLDRAIEGEASSKNEGEKGVVAEQLVQALVYTGAPTNPNFHLPASPDQRRRLETALIANATIEEDIRIVPRMDPFDLHRRNIMTDTIAAAVGPSGPNVDYLCNLESFLNSSGMHDPFLTHLAASVRLRLGPWRSRLYRAPGGIPASSSDAKASEAREVALSASALPFRLLGWGSNEFLQLSSRLPEEASGQVICHAGSAEARREALLEHRYAATGISSTLPLPLLASVSAPSAEKLALYSLCTAGTPEGRHVVAGGGTSAVLDKGVARVWGKLTPQLRKLIANEVKATATGNDSAVVGEAEGHALSQYEQSIIIEGVQGVAIGSDHLLLLLQLPVGTAVGGSPEGSTAQEVVREVVVAIGSDTHGQCAGSVAACAAVGIRGVPQGDIELQPSSTTRGAFTVHLRNAAATAPQTDTAASRDMSGRVLTLGAGMRHSALVTEAGELVTWGDSRHGQCLTALTAAPARSSKDGAATVDGDACLVWRPQNGARVLDVACGARHTVVVDSLGVAYQLGVTTVRDAAGRRAAPPSGVPVVVQGLPDRVRWQRVTSGWSHVALRGLSADADRSLVFYAWGRRNLCQFPADCPVTPGTDGPPSSNESNPVPLAALPGGRTAAEVWCGSEFTLAVDEDGGLWGCGWNEHGNLGIGAPSKGDNGVDADNVHSVVSAWQRVVHEAGEEHRKESVRLELIWEGAVACGGGHVLCLPE